MQTEREGNKKRENKNTCENIALGSEQNPKNKKVVQLSFR